MPLWIKGIGKRGKLQTETAKICSNIFIIYSKQSVGYREKTVKQWKEWAYKFLSFDVGVKKGGKKFSNVIRSIENFNLNWFECKKEIRNIFIMMKTQKIFLRCCDLSWRKRKKASRLVSAQILHNCLITAC